MTDQQGYPSGDLPVPLHDQAELREALRHLTIRTTRQYPRLHDTEVDAIMLKAQGHQVATLDCACGTQTQRGSKMKFLQDQNIFITEAGNSMTLVEIYSRGLNEVAELEAWPDAELQDINGDATGGRSPLGERPVFGEKRTLEALEKIIDNHAQLNDLVATDKEPK